MAAAKERIVSIDDEPAQSAQPVQADNAPVVVGANHDDQLSGKKVKIEIYESEGDFGKEAVAVQINGYAYQIPRGQQVIVPVEVMSVLDNSVMTLYDTKQGGGQVERKVKRFAYTVLGQ